MGLLGSFLGATIGWWTLGPIGAIMGLVFGHLSEEQTSFIRGRKGGKEEARSGFLATLLVLMAAVMKADGRLLRVELDYVKKSLVATFGESEASKALLMLRDIIYQDIPVTDVIRQARANINYASKLQLVQLLYGIALSDGQVTKEENDLLYNIAIGLGVTIGDFESIKAMFVKDNLGAYKVLELDESASNDELKKAYRKLVVRYHPDKVAHLGDDIQKSAEIKIKKVNEAYEQIKRERGLK